MSFNALSSKHIKCKFTIKTLFSLVAISFSMSAMILFNCHALTLKDLKKILSFLTENFDIVVMFVPSCTHNHTDMV